MRFRLPEPTEPYSGNHIASFFGPPCPQQVPSLSVPEGVQNITDIFIGNYVNSLAGPGSEDCKFM